MTLLTKVLDTLTGICVALLFTKVFCKIMQMICLTGT